MSLTITIDRIEGGAFRAAVTDCPGFVIERPDLPGLVAELKRSLDRIVIDANGRLALHLSDALEAAARATVEASALRNEELDELIDRHPVPAGWGREPGWACVD
jgi:hypothetical protein